MSKFIAFLSITRSKSKHKMWNVRIQLKELNEFRLHIHLFRTVHNVHTYAALWDLTAPII